MPLLCREEPMARGIPLVIIGGSWVNPREGEKASLLGFQGAEARVIGGIGINGVETNHWIMTHHWPTPVF